MVRYNSKGIRGYVRFSYVPEGIRIEANLEGLRGIYVHSYFPTVLIYQDNMVCPDVLYSLSPYF